MITHEQAAINAAVNEVTGTRPIIGVNKADEYMVFEWDALAGIPVWIGNEVSREDTLALMDSLENRLEEHSALFALKVEPGMFRINQG